MKISNPVSSKKLCHIASAIIVPLALVGCGTTTGTAVPIEEVQPGITYQFSDDEGLVNASFKAENYCKQYNAWPRVSQMNGSRHSGGEVTFTCGAQREEVATTSRTNSQPRTVDYTYQNEENLVDATIKAQQACARMGAEAKLAETRVEGQKRTIVFECVNAS